MAVVTDRIAELVRLTDAELVSRTYAAVGEHIPDEEALDEVYWLLGEAFERWAPEAEWADREHCLHRTISSPEDAAAERADARAAILLRAQERLRIRLVETETEPVSSAPVIDMLAWLKQEVAQRTGVPGEPSGA